MFRMNAIIATHGRRELLRRTLASLVEAHRPDGFERLIVVENGSDSGAREICREAADRQAVTYQHLEQAGKSRALQLVLEQLKDGFILFLDDDIRVCPELFEVYAAAARTHGPNAFYGGPLLIDHEGNPPPEWLVKYLPYSSSGWQLEESDAVDPHTRFLGANYGAFVDRLLRVGGFRSYLGPGSHRPGSMGNPEGEESDVQARLLSEGCPAIYLPDARVWHWLPEDRCTPRWALHRCYRRAVAEGIQETVPPGSPRLFGVPRWTWRPWLRLGVSALMANLLPDAETRFLVKRAFYQCRGRMTGMRWQRRIGRTAPGDGDVG